MISLLTHPTVWEANTQPSSDYAYTEEDETQEKLQKKHSQETFFTLSIIIAPKIRQEQFVREEKIEIFSLLLPLIYQLLFHLTSCVVAFLCKQLLS